MNKHIADGDIETLLPVIELSGELAKNATEGERALLAAAGVDIYESSGELVRPVVDFVTAAGGRKTFVAQLKTVTPVYLRDLLSRHAIWQSYVTREKKMVMRDPRLTSPRPSSPVPVSGPFPR